MKLGLIVNVYGFLGEAKMTTLSVEEILKVFDFRKVARPHVEEWNAFYNDIQRQTQTWEKMTEEQKTGMNKALEAEFEKDVEIKFDKLSRESVAGLVKENGLKPREAEMMGLMAE